MTLFHAIWFDTIWLFDTIWRYLTICGTLWHYLTLVDTIWHYIENYLTIIWLSFQIHWNQFWLKPKFFSGMLFEFRLSWDIHLWGKWKCNKNNRLSDILWKKKNTISQTVHLTLIRKTAKSKAAICRLHVKDSKQEIAKHSTSKFSNLPAATRYTRYMAQRDTRDTPSPLPIAEGKHLIADKHHQGT